MFPVKRKKVNNKFFLFPKFNSFESKKKNIERIITVLIFFELKSNLLVIKTKNKILKNIKYLKLFIKNIFFLLDWLINIAKTPNKNCEARVNGL
tara:strand:+ start:294 stop:575 length:282 start_codon:yes stop_codon:yes gene_type:complete